MTAAVQRTPRQSVAVAAIPAALRTIWRDCCSEQAGSSVSRALTINLIGVAAAEQAGELREAIDTLAMRLPCRAFVIALAPAGAAIRAEVFGDARTHGQARDLVREQIELETPRAAFGHVAGVVRPLLVNDLPTHFYWAMDWPAAAPHEFDALLALAEHAIVDSLRLGAPAVHIDALAQRRQQGRAITDLAWLRLRPWRRALAEAFERCAYARERPTAVTIRHGGRALAGAVLLGNWLEDRLAAAVALEPVADDRTCPVSVELRHGDARIVAALAPAGRIEVQVTTAASCFVPFAVPASRGSEGDLLAAAIDMA